VQFHDEQITFDAASPEALAAQYYDHHHQWLKARQVLLGERVYGQLRERATGFFDEVNEHPSEWRATDRYLAAVATLDRGPGRPSSLR